MRLTLTSSVFVTVRLSIDISEFFANDGQKKFITLVCVFLNISENRFKLLGVYPGSTIVDFYLLPPRSSVADSTTVVPNSTDIVNGLRALASKL